MLRIRASAIIVHNDQLLLMHRNKYDQIYHTFIGGGVEPGEKPEAAVIREVHEEASLRVELGSLVYELNEENGGVQYFYLCEYIGGSPEVHESTREHEANMAGQNTYRPVWVSLHELDSLTLYPLVIKERIGRDILNGFVDCPVIFQAPASNRINTG